MAEMNPGQTWECEQNLAVVLHSGPAGGFTVSGAVQIRSVPYLGTHGALPLTGAGFCPQVNQILRRNIVITIHEYNNSAVLGADSVGIHRHCRCLIRGVRSQISGYRIDSLPVVIKS